MKSKSSLGPDSLRGLRVLGVVLAVAAMVAGLIVLLNPGHAKAEPSVSEFLESASGASGGAGSVGAGSVGASVSSVDESAEELTLRGVFAGAGMVSGLRVDVPDSVAEVGLETSSSDFAISGDQVSATYSLASNSLSVTFAEPLEVEVGDRFELALVLDSELEDVTVSGDWSVRVVEVSKSADAASVLSLTSASSSTLVPSATATSAPTVEPRIARVTADGSTWIPRVEANPEMPKRCGLKIGLVFDLSRSILDQDRAIENMKTAASDIIEALAGTPTEIGLHTFNATSPATVEDSRYSRDSTDTSELISLFTSVGAENARAKIASLGAPSTFSYGGTNWEDALNKTIPFGYDSVYLITDGLPSTNREPDLETSTAKDRGQATHQGDLVEAIGAANNLKRSGTRIVPIMVNVKDQDELVLDDDVYMSQESARIGLPVTPRYYWINDSGDKTPTDAFRKKRLKMGKVEYVRNRWNDWTLESKYVEPDGHYSTRKAHQMAKDISSEDAPVFLDNYRELADRLAKSVIEPCQGKFIIEKRLVNQKGEFKKFGSGWSFEITSDGKNIISNGSQVDRFSGQTGEEGQMEIPLNGTAGDVELSVREIQQHGYSLRQKKNEQGDAKNAVCKINDGSEVRQAVIENIGNPTDPQPGFKIKVPTLSDNEAKLSTVTCQIDNQKPDVVAPKAEKLPSSDGPIQVQPNGEAMLEYKIRIWNDSEDGPAFVQTPLDTFDLADGVQVIDHVKVNATTVGTAKVHSPISSEDKDSIWKGSYTALAHQIELPNKGDEVTFDIRMLVKVTASTKEDWKLLSECEKTDGGKWIGGVKNSVLVSNDQDKSDDQACIPLLPPEKPSIRVDKVDANNWFQPLSGAEFVIYANENGDPDYETPIMEIDGNSASDETIDAGKYWLVEKRSPAGYELLVDPVHFEVIADDSGWSVKVLNGAGDLVTAGVSDDQKLIIMRIADIRGPELPRTGGSGVVMISLLGFALIVGGAIGLRRRA